MKKMILTALVMACLAQPAQAQSIDDRISDIGVDKFAHAGVSYAIADELHRHAGMNRFWAGFTSLCIGAAKEQFADDHFDKGDFAADMAGVVLFQF